MIISALRVFPWHCLHTVLDQSVILFSMSSCHPLWQSIIQKCKPQARVRTVTT